MKKIRYAAEAVILYFFFFLFRLLPLDMASACGGWVGRTIGPRLAASRKARRNIELSLPGRDIEPIIRGMWDNLGRLFAEYPHLRQIGRERVEIVGRELVEALRDDNKPAILFTAHTGNWEISAPALSQQYGLPVGGVYRAPNNPWADAILNRARMVGGCAALIPKSRTGTRHLVQALQSNLHIGILIDQKYNEGIAAPFFDRPAMTSPAFVQLAQKFDCPLVPGRMERLGGAHFRLTMLPPLAVDGGRSVEDVIKEAHTLLESWIAERPEQWLWLHRRWIEN